ncbi:MAG: STAS domain-containing protein [Chitinophagales bacterium]
MKVRETIIQEGLLKLAIEGDLDASSALTMDEVIKSAYEKTYYQVLIDCRFLEYISSAGLGVFISNYDDFQEKEGVFVFFAMKEAVYNVFELLGLHNIFDIVKNETEAVKKVLLS